MFIRTGIGLPTRIGPGHARRKGGGVAGPAAWDNHFFGENLTTRLGVSLTILGGYGVPHTVESWDNEYPDEFLEYCVETGFDHARIAVSPSFVMGAADETAARSEIDVDLHAIDRCLAAGLPVILDMHVTFETSDPYDAADIEADYPNGKWALLLSRAITLYGRVLEERGYTNQQVMFEPYNENTIGFGLAWPEMLGTIVTAFRAVNLNTTLLLSGAAWSHLNGLLELDPADYGQNTIFNFHYYEPMVFTHQNAAIWSDIHDLKYPPVPADKAAAIAAAPSMTADLTAYFDTPQDGDYIADRFGEVEDWRTLHGIAASRIWVSEFGNVGDYPDASGAGGSLLSRKYWFADVTSVLSDLGYAGTVWAAKSPDRNDITDDYVFNEQLLIGLGLVEQTFHNSPWDELELLPVGSFVGQIGDSLGTNGAAGSSDGSQILQSLRNLPMKAWGFAPCFKYDYYNDTGGSSLTAYFKSRCEFSRGGDDVGQMVDRIINDGEADDTPAKIMILGPSPNDSAVGLTAAQVIGHLETLANFCFDNDIRVVMKTYPPRGVSDSLPICSTTPGGSLAYNNAFWATMATVNAWIDTFANPLLRPCKKLDLNTSDVVRSGTLSDGNANPGNVFEPKDNFYLDNLHPAATAVWFWGKALSQIIVSAFESAEPWFDDDPTVTNNFQRNGTNQGPMTGTPAALSGTHTTVTGNCPGGWDFQRNGDSLLGITLALDVADDSGNSSFKTQRVDASVNNASGGMNTFRSFLRGAGTIPFTSGNGIGAVANDTWWQMFCRVKIDGWSGWRQFQPRIGTVGSPAFVTYCEIANWRSKEVIWPEAFDGFWLATPPHKKVSGNTSWFPLVDLAVNANGQTGTGQIDFSRFILREMASAPDA